MKIALALIRSKYLLLSVSLIFNVQNHIIKHEKQHNDNRNEKVSLRFPPLEKMYVGFMRFSKSITGFRID